MFHYLAPTETNHILRGYLSGSTSILIWLSYEDGFLFSAESTFQKLQVVKLQYRVLGRGLRYAVETIYLLLQVFRYAILAQGYARSLGRL